MMPGLMMDVPLTVPSILRHALTFHPRSTIVSRLADNSVHRYSYEDFGKRVHQAANALIELGVRPGDRVATLAWNGHRHLELYYAISGIGAVCHTVNPRLFRDQIAYILNHAEDTLVFFNGHFSALVASLAKDLPHVRRYIVLEDSLDTQSVPVERVAAYEDILKVASTKIVWPHIEERSACGLCYTSGTTGNPKGVLYSHRSNVLHALAISGGDWLSIRQRDSILPVVPMFHANAWGLPYAGILNGSKLVLPGHALDAKSLYELIDNERVTLTAAVPAVWSELIRHLRETGKRLGTLERVMTGGSAPPSSLVRAFEEEYGVSVMQAWGMTELSPVGSFSSLKAHETELPAEARWAIKTKQGRPLFGVEVRLIKEDKTVPFDGDSTGELQVRGPWVASSYYEDTRSDAFTEDGWFRTGDIASIDSEGTIEIKDRAKDLIKSGGEWISSIELEKIASDHPDVLEAACIGVPHSKWGERPMIVAVLRQGATMQPADLLSLYEGKIPRWSIPDHVEFVSALPRTATGKISKLTLRQQFAGALVRAR
jgi:3-(methylthio)propionyl---CoA ligase